MLQARITVTVLAATAALLITLSKAHSDTNNTAATSPHLFQRSLRLPNTTFPLRYHLHISSNIHMAELKYAGNVTIDIDIRQSTNEIVLHAKNLSDFAIRVWQLHSGELLDDLTFSYDHRCSFLIIHPIENYQAFEAGQVLRVEILYRGVMHEKTHGLYWLTYNNHHDNTTVYLAATQSEPSYARLVFPCYDEPSFKSNFTIELTHGSKYMAISNMHVQQVQEHDDGSLKTTLFYPSPPMCTYLVAFVISDFEYIAEEYRGVTQRIFTSPHTADKGYGALRNAVRTLAALEDYFGISYPLTKLDHIALNKNYGAAMENWGLITYKENNLINQDHLDPHKQLKDVLTQNHELVHQWFGNLVSPEWWTYAWLTEGFATYFSYVITDMLYPELKVMEFFLKDIAERAFSYSHISVRPMTFYVERDAEILAVFDIITYQRAACVVRMFHHAFNQPTFMHGINKFLQNFAYLVANETNLFESVQAALQADELFSKQAWIEHVPEIMRSWTHTEWLPIVSVQRNYADNTITIIQQSKDQHTHELWWIPINFATTTNPQFQRTTADYFMPPIENVTLSHDELGLTLSANDWVIINKQQTGFYHVLYDDANLLAIAKQLQRDHSVIHPTNRAAIFQDLDPLIEHNNLQSVDVIFELLKYLEHEQDLVPWNFVADTLHFFERNLYGTSSHLLYKRFIQRLVAPLFQQLHMQPHPANITNTEILARQKIMELACMADLPECLQLTHNMARDFIFQSVKFQTAIDYYGMSDTILCLGVKYLTDEEFDSILSLLAKADRESLWYDDLIYSLRCTQSRKHLRQYLNVLVGENSTHVIMNDSESMMYLFYLYKANLAARPVVWHFFERNYRVLCRSPFFAENFNRIAEYVPERFKHKFIELRETIALELDAEGYDASTTLITADSYRIGKKAKTSELFLQKFETQIYEWLARDQTPSVFAAATFDMPNAAPLRANTMFHWAGKILRKALNVQF